MDNQSPQIKQENQDQLSRREIIRRALVLAGAGSLIGSSTLLAACATNMQRDQAEMSTTFTKLQIQWLDEVAETILPETDTPGAKAAQVGGFIAIMVVDTYSPEERKMFRAGMESLEEECRREWGVGFVAANQSQRLTLLERLDLEQKNHADNKTPDAPSHYFSMIKQLTVVGYFTSEIGYKQALRYVESPGRFDPCVEYKAGERAWARHA